MTTMPAHRWNASIEPGRPGRARRRTSTFWLPILPGWLAYRALRADGTV
jgi:hypothetical protein